MSENTAVVTPVVKTKEEKIAAIEAQIAKLTLKLDDVRNDRVPTPAAKKVAYMPVVGDKVLAPVGRTTATTTAKTVEGTVTAIKAATFDEAGKLKSAAQVRVRINEGGFDEQLVTLYPAQLVAVPAAEQAAE
jgi:hypothetical protein